MGFGNRGTYAEDKVEDYLIGDKKKPGWQTRTVHREAHRLTDTKAAGRIIKAAHADFEYFDGSVPTDNRSVVRTQFGLIEVKQTEHEYRLSRDKVPQLARLRKRSKCGGTCYVLVYHSTLKVWRALTVPYMVDTGDLGSWNVSDLPQFLSCGAALAHISPGVFEA